MTQSGHGQEGQSWGQAPGQPWGPPPPRPAPDEDPATQYLRPVPPASAPLPPERGPMPPESPAESTAFLGTGFGAQPGQGQPQPPQAAPQPPQYQQPQPQPHQPQPHQAPQPPHFPQPQGPQPPHQAQYGYPPQQSQGYGYPPPQAQQPGYGYPPQQPGYGYPPPQAQQPGYGYPPPPQQPYGQQPPHQQPGGPQGHAQQPGGQRQPDPDSEATQFIAPVPGNSGPPAEFDSLFRDDRSGATQQMPRIDAHAPQPPYGQAHQPRPPHGNQPPYGGPQHGGYDDYDEPPRRSSKLPLVAAVVVGCAVVGLGAGALLSGGDDKADDKADVAAVSSPVPASSAPASSEPAPDPAKAQAEELDKLLADSNDSRDAVIRSVENIKKCQQLDKAAADLKAAAGQRRELVNRLGAIRIDKLPDHTSLSASLTKAWQASATADDHYAAWALQVKKPKNCKDGKARNTGSTAQAAVASGEATTAKKEAARLWNGIAETYGLTKRQPTQL
ncbi:hypothetical protein [Streptomyces sp. enrichment culture]|uniref:hypothetical protein n=1 Tax=Streptomyces sp. enrichment culture TaxID=1795815 RepID=UPI003F556A23